MSEKKNNKCTYDCVKCENRDKDTDFCKIKGIENCSKVAPAEFSKCSDYLIDSKLIMF